MGKGKGEVSGRAAPSYDDRMDSLASGRGGHSILSRLWDGSLLAWVLTDHARAISDPDLWKLNETELSSATELCVNH